MLKNIFKVFKDPNSFIIWFLSTVVAFFLWFLYSDIDYVAANYDSRIFAYFDAGLSWIMILVLPLMIAGIFYRSFRFGEAYRIYWCFCRECKCCNYRYSLLWGESYFYSWTYFCYNISWYISLSWNWIKVSWNSFSSLWFYWSL